MNTGESKSASLPVLNDLALAGTGNNTYSLTGDVTNAGITDASGLVLSVGAPAHPVQPYASYAVGALASDDFSSFTLTFVSNDLSSIPIIVQWKDAYGNALTTTKILDLRPLPYSGTGSQTGGDLSASYPLIYGGIILIFAIVLWMKRRWIVAKFRR